MYLHLGQNVVVAQSDIIGIFDIDNTTSSKITRKFLNDAEKAKRIINVSDDIPRSYVISEINNEIHIHISQLSPQTLLKRTETTFV